MRTPRYQKFWLPMPGTRLWDLKYRRRCQAAEPTRARKDVYLQAPYLEGLPQITDLLAHLAGCRHLTDAEEKCVSKQVQKVCKVIREARTQWEAEQADVVPCL